MTKATGNHRQSTRKARPELDQAIVETAGGGAAAAKPGRRSLTQAAALSPDYIAHSGVKKQLVNVAVRKPKKSEWFRVHPQWHFDAGTLEHDDESGSNVYLVLADAQEELAELVTPARIAVCVNRHGVPFVWPLKLPKGDARPTGWHKSSMAAFDAGVSDWTRMAADMGAGQYAVYTTKADLPDPKWPENVTFDDVLEIAFEGCIIDHPDHEVARAIIGGRS